MNKNAATHPPASPRRRQKHVATVLGVLLLLFIGMRIRERQKPPPLQPRPPLAVRTQVLEPVSFALTRTYVGTIEAVQRVVLSTELTGRVLSVPWREGQLVGEGELLVKIDDEEESREIGRIEAGLRRLKADLAFWEPQLDRDRKLLEGRSISRERHDETVRRLDGLRASIQENEQALALARVRRAYSEVRAPFAGAIQSVGAQPGELALPGMKLIELVGENALKAVANVPQVDLRMLAKGQRVLLTTPAETGDVEAVVDRVYPALDALSRTATVEVFLPPGQSLRPGMVVTLEIYLEETDNVLVVARQALRSAKSGEGVFVAREGVAAWQPVVTGAAQGHLVSLVSGLAAGDAVIVTPNPQLKEGREILVWEESK